MHSSRTTHMYMQRQRGAVFIVMLVIMIIGVAAFLVSSLSKVALQTARNEKSSDLLAQVKEVVVGYAVKGTGGVRPGDLLIPDVLSPTETPPYNYDGVTEGGCLDASKPLSTPIPGVPVIGSGANMRCLGRLPWKNFSLPIDSPSENDPTGFMPWYAVSANLVDPSHVTINSELLNTDNTMHLPNNYPVPPHPWLTVRDMKGNVLSDRVAFIIFIPGAALSGQARSASPNLGGANQYLDSITVPAGCTLPCTPGVTYNNFDLDDDFIMGDEHRWIDDPANPGKQIEDPNYNFNDKLLYVTIDELMPFIEKRIAREVKSCLDDFAAVATNTNHKYPWAALVSDTTAFPNRTGTYNVLFGRVSEIPSNATSGGGPLPPIQQALQNQIIALQTALANYLNGTGTLSNLTNTGDTLKDFALNSPYNLPSTDPAVLSGLYADNWNGSSSSTTLTGYINSALNALSPSDNTLPGSWAGIPSCNKLILNSTYWTDWRDLVFYQVANGYQPGGAGTCTVNTTCLSIGGSGNPAAGNGSYRASVIIAGKILPAQTRPSTANPPDNYLEVAAGNSHQSQAGATPSVNFITYRPSDTANYLTVNDLVLCVDGKNNCQ